MAPRPASAGARPGGIGRLAAVAALAAVALIGAACGSGGGRAGPTTTSTAAPIQAGGLGPERVPIPSGPPLGPVKSSIYGQPIDAIQCEASEQIVYHIHAHLTIFVDGQPRQVPYGIGIGPPIQLTDTPAGAFVSGGSCFYWLHTHAADGVIHIESPSQKLYTLGQFFDVWGQPLGPGQVGPATGTVTIFVDGKPVTGNPREVELKLHDQVQLDVGAVVAPQSMDWSQTGF